MKDLEEIAEESFRLWLYHAEKGAELYEWITKEQIASLKMKGWCDHPDTAKAYKPEPAVSKPVKRKPGRPPWKVR